MLCKRQCLSWWPQEHSPCYEGATKDKSSGYNYDDYLYRQINQKMMALFSCSVAFNPLVLDEAGRNLPVCNYSQAGEALEHYANAPSAAESLWSSKDILLVKESLCFYIVRDVYCCIVLAIEVARSIRAIKCTAQNLFHEETFESTLHGSLCLQTCLNSLPHVEYLHLIRVTSICFYRTPCNYYTFDVTENIDDSMTFVNTKNPLVVCAFFSVHIYHLTHHTWLTHSILHGHFWPAN